VNTITRKALKIVIPIMITFSACTANRIDAPDADFDAIRTQAVQTAVMQITADAVLHPKANATPLPSISSQAAALSEPGSEERAIKTGEDVLENALPAEGNLGSFACAVDTDFQSQPDGPRQAGVSYTKIWRIHNTGSASWRSDQVTAKWVGGTHLCTKDKINLGWNVVPGDTVEIRVPVHVPENPSTTPLMMAWALVDGEGNIFCKFYHSINVVE